MKTLPRATPAAKTKLFSIFRPKSARLQASVRFSMRWRCRDQRHGHQIDRAQIVGRGDDTTTKGASADTSPRNSTTWQKISKMGVRSTMAS